jgi:hypothetical protein
MSEPMEIWKIKAVLSAALRRAGSGRFWSGADRNGQMPHLGRVMAHPMAGIKKGGGKPRPAKRGGAALL